KIGVKRQIHVPVKGSPSVIHGYPRLVREQWTRDQFDSGIGRSIISILGNKRHGVAYWAITQESSRTHVEDQASIVDVAETIEREHGIGCGIGPVQRRSQSLARGVSRKARQETTGPCLSAIDRAVIAVPPMLPNTLHPIILGSRNENIRVTRVDDYCRLDLLPIRGGLPNNGNICTHHASGGSRSHQTATPSSCG